MKTFDKLRNKILATFYLPDIVEVEPEMPKQCDNCYQRRWQTLCHPFAIYMVHQRLVPPDNVQYPEEMWTDTIVYDNEGVIDWCARDHTHWRDGEHTYVYWPEDAEKHKFAGHDKGPIPHEVFEMIVAFDRRDVRFIDDAVRQFEPRNASKGYKEFSVIPKTSTRYKYAETAKKLFPHARRLHLVRSHMRHLASGKVTVVSAHQRGTVLTENTQQHYLTPGATMQQIKDHQKACFER
jgi:hypothetical protein